MLQIDKLTVAYEGAHEAPVLRNLSFSLAAGERAALMGPNGAGKSTLLSALTGLVMPQSGTVSVNGRRLSPKNLHPIRREMGLLFQNPDDQLFMPTVLEDVMFGPLNNGTPAPEAEALAEAVLARLGISALKQRMTQRLSGGEKRLAALAGLLVMQPSVLLMDEPTAFLDPRASRMLVEVLKELPQALLIATHDKELAGAVCTRVILVNEGAVASDGPISMLNDEPLLRACGL